MNQGSIVSLLVVIIYILLKDVIVPLVKKRNHARNNPIDVSRFYQEFKDFKEEVGKRIGRIEEWIDKQLK